MSSDASRTFFPFRSFNRLASFAVVVVLPDPCKPTISTVAGGLSIFSASAGPSPCSTRTSSSWTNFTTICPGVTDFVTADPVALSCTRLMKSRATGSETSASNSATRTSRSAATTSASVSAPALVRRSNTPPRRSDRLSNMRPSGFVAVQPDMGVRRRECTCKDQRHPWAQRADGWRSPQMRRDRKRMASGELPAALRPQRARVNPSPPRRRAESPCIPARTVAT